MAKQLYKLTLTRGYPQDEHHRAGLLLRRGGTLVTELSKDQLEAVKNDSYIELSKATDGEQSQAPELSEGAGVASNATVGAAAPDRTASEGDQADQDQAAESEEATDGEGAGASASDVDAAVPTEPVSGEAGSEPTREDEAADGEQAPGSDAAQDEAGSTPATDSPADTSEPAEAQQTVENDAGEDVQPTVDELVRDNDRPTLDKMAADAGVVDADKMQNKLEVAQAIVEKRG